VIAASSVGPLVVFLVLTAAPIGPGANAPRAVAPGDQATLQAAGLPVDGPTLLRFLTRRADPDAALKEVDAAVARLAEAGTDKHAPAQVELLGCGPVALPALRRLANRIDLPEASARARTCVGLIESPAGGNLCLAVARAAAALRPEGIDAALFAYLPFAETEPAFRDLQQLLVGLCPSRGDLPEPFSAALKDADPIRRQAGAEVLCAARGVAAHGLVRPLLEDPKASVRLRVALVLTESYDPAAVPVLIDHLGSAGVSERKRIEETLSRLAGDWSFQSPPAEDRTAGEIRRALWKAWWDTLSEERLLSLFRAVTHAEADHVTWQAILARLDDPEASVRDRAVAELVAVGPRVLPLVRRVAGEGSPRSRGLAGQAVTALERQAGVVRVPECAPRLLALRRPADTARVLLDALPWMENPLLEQQVRDVLPLVAVVGGKPSPVLRERFASKLPAVRAAAAAALARVGGPDDLAKVRELLDDPDPAVRLDAALGLVQRGQRDAVEVLIALMPALPLEKAGAVEDLLIELAAEKAPNVGLGTGPQDRDKSRDAWLAWWRDHGDKVALDDGLAIRLRPRTLLLVESYDQARRSGRVIEMDRTGRVLLDVQGMSYPMYAERIGPDRVLIAEQGTGKVTERDTQGRVVKEWAVPSAFYCQRLRNGNTFLGGRNQLQEVDRDGKVAWTYASPQDTIFCVTRFRDGNITLLTYQGNLVRLDAAGKVVKTSNVPIQTLGGLNGAEILPGDRVLVTSSGTNRVVEFDENGKVAWETSVPTPASVSRLPGGTTLVSSTGNTRLVEIDRAGRVVQEWKDLPVKPIRATLR